MHYEEEDDGDYSHMHERQHFQVEEHSMPRRAVFPTPLQTQGQCFSYPPVFGQSGRRGSHDTPSRTRRMINISIYTLPRTTIWVKHDGNTFPMVANWPADVPSVTIAQPPTMKWGGNIYPTPHSHPSIEHDIAVAFARLPQYQHTSGSFAGLFYKRSRRAEGTGSNRGFRLQPFAPTPRSPFGSLTANTYLVYCPEPAILPRAAIASYTSMLSMGRCDNLHETPNEVWTTPGNVPLPFYLKNY